VFRDKQHLIDKCDNKLRHAFYAGFQAGYLGENPNHRIWTYSSGDCKSEYDRGYKEGQLAREERLKEPQP